jgi:hypothetical protein
MLRSKCLPAAAVVLFTEEQARTGRCYVQEDLLHLILNRRFNNLCRQGNCAVYAAVSSTEPVVTNCSAHNVVILPLPGSELVALEIVLLELARLRLHGAAEVCTPPLSTFFSKLYGPDPLFNVTVGSCATCSLHGACTRGDHCHTDIDDAQHYCRDGEFVPFE